MSQTPSHPFLSTRAAVCPQDLLTKAASDTPPIVAIARAGAALPMEAAKIATEQQIMIPLFVGEANDIKAHAATLDWDISGYEIINTDGEAAAGAAAATACGKGRAQILMKGHLHTDAFMKAALARDAGLRTGGRLVHIFHMTHPDGGKPLLVSDAAVNVTPNLETRKAATEQVVHLLHTLGNPRPKIAMLSATESAIPSVPSSEEARDLSDWATETIANADFSGPLAMDLILSPEAVSIKGMDSDPVAGRADGIIVPDIVSGNAIFKSLVYLSGGCAAGVVLGAKVPILLTSRADPPAARLASVALAAILSAPK